MTVTERPRPAAAAASISPSALGVFFALDQCKRYLRLALMPREGAGSRNEVLTRAGVTSEQIPPTLSVEGKTFERLVEDALRGTDLRPRLHQSDEDAEGGVDPLAPDLLRRIDRLLPGECVVVGQNRLEAELGRWQVQGQPDIVVASLGEDGRLSVLLCDIKASREPRLEHRLQVALYARMLAAHRPDAEIEQAVIYRRPPVVPDDAAALEVFRADEAAALERLGIDVALLSVVTPGEAAEFDALLDRVLLAPDSEAARTVAEHLDDLPFHLERKCDVCAFNELCLKRARETGDLSLVPYLDAQDKTVFRLHGVETVADLAGLDDGPPGLRRTLQHTWPVNERLGELTVRAASYLQWQKEEDVEVSEFLDHGMRGYGTLPAVSATQHPNLVQVFLDAQLYDPDERVYSLGALVRVHRDGGLVPGRQRAVVRLLGAAPRADEDERGLLTDWLREVLEAIRDLAFPRWDGDQALAPIHLYMFEGHTQEVLLGAVQRNADAVFGVEALFQLLTQRAAFDTGNISVVATEVERQWNLPMLCQSLQAVAAYKGFTWDGGRPLRATFHHRHFDQLGRYERGEEVLFAPKRSRFKSDVPIEYAYLAWGGGAADASGRQREAFGTYGSPTLDDLRALGAARLDALAYLVEELDKNRQTTKSDFDLARLLSSVGGIRPPSTLSAMKNFVVVERHVTLNAWRAAHAQRPRQRVVTGNTLIGVYRDSDQPVEVRKRLRETWAEFERKHGEWAAKRAAGEEAGPEPSWVYPAGLPVRLELTEASLGVEPGQAVRRCDLKEESWVVVAPEETVDTRPDAPSKEPFAPTPRQLMLATRGEIAKLRQEGDRWWVEVTLKAAQQKGTPCFTFRSSRAEVFRDGRTYTLDSDPSSPSDKNRLTVIEEVEGGFPHPFVGWLERRAGIGAEWPPEAEEGQRRFYEGLRRTGIVVEEVEKERYVAGHGARPVLLVQGPPGTGKSFATAFAVLARVQGALAAGLPMAVAVSCQTHAATDVVVGKIAQMRDRLAQQAQAAPVVFAEHFDPRLLDLQVIRSTDGEDWETKAIPGGCRRFSHKTTSARVNEVAKLGHVVVGGTPKRIRDLGKEAVAKSKHGPIWDLCVVDEASQMTAPDALQATVGLRPSGRVAFVGDHRQMPPIVHNDWDRESEVTFDPYAMHRSIFDLVKERLSEEAQEKFARSFRLHPDVAEYLRREVYDHDGIDYHSLETPTFESRVAGSALVEAVLNSPHPLLVVRHTERSSQQRNDVEAEIVEEIYRGLLGRRRPGDDRPLDAGTVVPHRAQRAEIRDRLIRGFGDDDLGRSVDTVERFQGGEREVILVSATESDPAYLRKAGEFLFDPRRLTVAISRATHKLVVVASRSVFEYLPADLETLRDTALWRNLLDPRVTESILVTTVGGVEVEVFGSRPIAPPRAAPPGSILGP